MMDALVIALCAGGSAALAYLATRVRGRAEAALDAPVGARSSPRPEAPAPLAGFPFQVGDVVVAEGGERWLSGALVARESGVAVGALFVAPEGRDQAAIAAFPAPGRAIYWLAPVAVECPREPPATIDLDGVVLTRKARLPVVIERLGRGAPALAEHALWAIYEAGSREVGLVLCTGSEARAWRGRKLEEGEYERLGAGEPA